MIQCSTCRLTEVDGVLIAGDGVCSICRDFERRKVTDPEIMKVLASSYPERRVALAQRFEKLKSQNHSPYDCLLYLSGGKDSVMVLYELVNIYDLRVLAYMHDNGFESSAAITNSHVATKKLGIDLIYHKTYDIYWPFYYFFRSELRKTIDICTFCEAFQEPSCMFADALMEYYDIPLAITGSSITPKNLHLVMQSDHEIVQQFLASIAPQLRDHGCITKRRITNPFRPPEQDACAKEKFDYWCEIYQDIEETVRTVKREFDWQPKYTGGTDTGCDLGTIQWVLNKKYPSKKTAYNLITAQAIRTGSAEQEFYSISEEDAQSSAKAFEDDLSKILACFNLRLEDL